MADPKPRNHYWREPLKTAPGEDGRTEQHHAKSCDINTIMARYVKTGVMDHISKYEPRYGDVSSADWQAAQNLVAGVKTEFEELPAYVRDYYEGNADNYLDAMQTDEGVNELRNIRPPGQKYETDGSPAVETPEPEPAPTPEPS